MAVELPASEDESAARARRSSRPAPRWPARAATSPTSFVAQLYGRAVPEDVVRYGAADLADAGRAGLRFPGRAAPGTPKIRCETRDARPPRRAQVGLGDRDRQRRHAVPGRLGDGRTRRPPARRAAGGASGVRRAARRRQAQSRSARPTPAPARAKASSISIVEPIEDDAARADLVRALRAVLARCGCAVQDWRPMLARVNGIVAELKTNPPPLPVDEIAEAIQFLQWLLADNFTFLGVRDYTFDGDRRSSPISTARSASCARASCACSSAATSCSSSRRRSWRS